MLAQGLRAVVVDDGSPEDRSDLYAEVRRLGAEVIELEKNSGIGFALNRGIERSFAEGAEFVITVDQDTILCDGYVDGVRDALRQIGDARPVLLWTERINGRAVPTAGESDGFAVLHEPLQSGLVVTARVYDLVGALDEELFIDCVDSEYALRARTLGVDTLVAPGTEAIHQLGYKVERRAPRILAPRGKPFMTIEHAPFRLYYIARNRSYIYARYGWRYREWFKISAVQLRMVLFAEIVFPPDSATRFYLAARGFYGAARGEKGAIPPRVLRRAATLSRWEAKRSEAA